MSAREKPNAIKRETMAWSDEYIVRILRNGAFLVGTDMLYAIALVCEAADRIEVRSVLSKEAIEAGAKWLRELDLGPLDKDRRPVDWPSLGPCCTWADLPERTRDNYRHRARGVLQAASEEARRI